jgi:hypothetical protein
MLVGKTKGKCSEDEIWLASVPLFFQESLLIGPAVVDIRDYVSRLNRSSILSQYRSNKKLELFFGT